MAEYVLRTRQLSKQYNGNVVLDRVNLNVPKGSIYGFIGQNGAGKSTWMRIAAGLAGPSAGSVELFGETDEARVNRARSRIGLTIESPALFPDMTAEENLEVQRRQKGIRDMRAIGAALEMVGLQETGKKRVGDYSLGMKQRLDLAVAMLGEPELLILDEPTNGLDPINVVEVRALLKRLNRHTGTTILISSHVLSELHQLATHYGIIHRGKLLEELTAQELGERCRQYLHIKVDDPARGAAVIGSVLGTEAFELLPDGTIRLFEGMERPGEVSAMLVKSGLVIEQFMPMGEQLENYYIRRIGGAEREAAARG